MVFNVVRRRCTFVVLAAVFGIASGCSETDIAPVGQVLNITLLPNGASVALGDSVALTLRGDSKAASRGRVRWWSGQPGVLRLDTTVAAGRPVFARGVGVGDAAANFTLVSEGSSMSGSVPVTVR